MGIFLKNARKKEEFSQGDYFQNELKEVITNIWENQMFLDNQDLEDLKKFT